MIEIINGDFKIELPYKIEINNTPQKFDSWRSEDLKDVDVDAFKKILNTILMNGDITCFINGDRINFSNVCDSNISLLIKNKLISFYFHFDINKNHFKVCIDRISNINKIHMDEILKIGNIYKSDELKIRIQSIIKEFEDIILTYN